MSEPTLNLLLLGATAEVRLCTAAYAVGAEPGELSRAIPFVVLPARRKDAAGAATVLHLWHGLDFKPGSLIDMSSRFDTSALSYLINSHGVVLLVEKSNPAMEHEAGQFLQRIFETLRERMQRLPVALVTVLQPKEQAPEQITERVYSPQDGQTICNRLATRFDARDMTYHELMLAPGPACPALTALMADRMHTSRVSRRVTGAGTRSAVSVAEGVAPSKSRAGRCLEGENPRLADTPMLTLWMVKRGVVVRNWKRRCIRVFEDGAALYYEREDDFSTLRGSLQIPCATYYALDSPKCRGIDWPDLAFADGKALPSSLFFGLQPANSLRVFYFVCFDGEDSASTMVTSAKWLAVLQRFGVSLPSQPLGTSGLA